MARPPRQLEALSRMLAYVLCHRPDEFGLVLAEDGFVPIKSLLQVLAAEPGWGHVRRHHLEQVAALVPSPRFEILGEHIRGLTPGPADLRRPVAQGPPTLLYASIPPKAHASVAEHGLRPGPGRELLLAAQPELALKLGRRRFPEPVLITVQAKAAAQAGIAFQGYGNDLFLAPAIPQEFIQAPPLPKEPEKPKPKPKPAQPEPPLPPPGTLPGDLAQFMKKAGKLEGKKGEPAWKTATRKERRKRRD
jgi:putative RNA 2'-phosphotransferase